MSDLALSVGYDGSGCSAPASETNLAALLNPIHRQVGKPGDPQALPEMTTDCRSHNVGSQECKRERVADMSFAAAFATRERIQIQSSTKGLVEPSPCGRNGDYELRARLRSHRLCG